MTLTYVVLTPFGKTFMLNLIEIFHLLIEEYENVFFKTLIFMQGTLITLLDKNLIFFFIFSFLVKPMAMFLFWME